MRAAVVLSIVSLGISVASAEIVVQPGDSAGDAYVYVHPALRSLVFVSPESRQMAVLPPSPVFIVPPPLLLRAPSTMPAYPPVAVVPGFNAPRHPSNRDNVSYSLRRGHAFSQNLYRRGVADPLVRFYGAPWLNLGANYPPVGIAGFNQTARPSNRDNTTYLLERSHQFRMDAYKP